MTRVGITGHTDLTPDTAELVSEQLRVLLAQATTPLIGVTCLAPGADQIFAEVVLDLGGRVEVVLPAADYREAKVGPADRSRFDALLGHASHLRTMPFPNADRDAYRAAALAVLDTANLLMAVWDGVPDGRPGSTGDTVAAARRRRLPVTVVWPEGAHRGGGR